MNRIVYKTDKGHRKGCHPVVKVTEKWDGRKKKVVESEDTIFLIDEPGAWWAFAGIVTVRVPGVVSK